MSKAGPELKSSMAVLQVRMGSVIWETSGLKFKEPKDCAIRARFESFNFLLLAGQPIDGLILIDMK